MPDPFSRDSLYCSNRRRYTCIVLGYTGIWWYRGVGESCVFLRWSEPAALGELDIDPSPFFFSFLSRLQLLVWTRVGANALSYRKSPTNLSSGKLRTSVLALAKEAKHCFCVLLGIRTFPGIRSSHLFNPWL
ncbi:uncharacterized protein CIMG_13694 [Coccidioides immitis RS]|uniref:Uncharacterized protein n=1 Tax=Coccidioides immitis (strain RS) TaxID=246410 RepID=A0A0D8JX05_COCIM|nr:uncharacterized protein CIMG_13694 [Coccidioides immitis RS]KJF61471.1 hypothetical protein CIMG_13694 [Coccidioides immitis RS]